MPQHWPARRGEDAIRPHQCCRTVAQDQGHEVEGTDDDDRPGNGAARLGGGGHGVEAHQHVRQATHAEHQGNTQGDKVQLGGGGGAVLQARGHDVLGLVALLLNLLGGGVHVDGVIKQGAKAAAQGNEDQETHDDHAGDQKHGLNHLHVGGALHAADQDVDNHEHAHDADDEGLPRSRGYPAARPPASRRRPSAR